MEKAPTIKEATENRFYDAVEDESWLEDQKDKAESVGDVKTASAAEKYLADIKVNLQKLSDEVAELEKQLNSSEKDRELGERVRELVDNKTSIEPKVKEKGYDKHNPYTGQTEHFETKEELEAFNDFLKENNRSA